MSVDQVIQRVAYLQSLHSPMAHTRSRIRALMDGGVEAVVALLGDKMQQLTDMTPIPPLLNSGLAKLAQKIGMSVPDLKVPPYGYKDSQEAKRAAEKRERIVQGYDEGCAIELQLPQVGRWLPGYGYVVWIIKDGFDDDGSAYPYAQLRDPYECYPGVWSVDQQPEEMAVVYQTHPEVLVAQYPELADTLRKCYPRGQGGAVLLPGAGGGSWSNQSGDGVTVAEYYYRDGTFIVLPEHDQALEFIPNPIAPRNRFVIAKRFAFNRLTGAYDHVIALSALMAKIDILQYIAMEDGVMTETNIMGDVLDGQKYRKGRNAINRFPQGTRVEKPVSNMPYQVFQMVDRIERRLRIGASYPVQDDSQAPVQYLTGRGLDGLSESRDAEIKEYQKVLRRALETLDSRRLEWDETLNYGSRPLVSWRSSSGSFAAETYDPSRDIGGRYKTRRVYGWAAGWDEQSKIVAGLQLLQAGAIDIETFRENLDGLDNLRRVDERVRARGAEESLSQMLLEQAANPQDPAAQVKAAMALVEIMTDPATAEKVLIKFFTAKGEDMTAEEQAMIDAAGQQPDPMGGAGGMPPDITTVLSQLPMSGPVEGGVQTVGRL
ncbi:MAG: hypothetical protein ABIJ75_02500 [Actinomycetota bacterium]